MIEYLLTSAVIFAVLTAWQYVDYRYRRFANDNPALGPFRPEAGCGDGCSCSQGRIKNIPPCTPKHFLSKQHSEHHPHSHNYTQPDQRVFQPGSKRERHAAGGLRLGNTALRRR